MSRFSFMLLAGWLSLLFMHEWAIAADLTLYTEEYPPITFSKNGKATGLGTEVVEEIMRRLDVKAPIEVVPWARGYKNVTTGSKVALFVTTRTEEREKLFKWVGPVSATTAHFYFRRGGAQFDSMEQARRADRILIPRDWYLHQMLQASGFSNIYPVPTPVAAVRMLASGRAPMMALDDVTLIESLNEAGVTAQQIETGPVITQAVQYIAFWRDAPEELIQRWQKTLDEMKADGSFDKIYAKWLPGVVPPGR